MRIFYYLILPTKTKVFSDISELDDYIKEYKPSRKAKITIKTDDCRNLGTLTVSEYLKIK